MDDSDTYMNVKFAKTDSRSPSGAEPDVSYAELNVKTLSAPRVRTDGDGLNSTYSELNLRKEEPRIDEDEDPPISSGPGGLSTTAQADPHAEQPKENIENRLYRKICLLCLATFVLFVTVVGLSIHVSEIRHSLITCDRNHQEFWEQYQEMNRTQRLQVNELNSALESNLTEISRLAITGSSCLKNISVLNNNLSKLQSKLFVLEKENSVLNTRLSDLNQTQSDLLQTITDFEIQYRSLTEEKAQICRLLTSRKDQTCSRNWIRYKDRCYLISSVYGSYDAAKQECSSFESSLLEINSNDEAMFVYNSVPHGYWTYWIGKCEDRNVESNLLYWVKDREPSCTRCKSSGWNYNCIDGHYFICEKSALLSPDVPDKIRDLCQETLGRTLIK